MCHPFSQLSPACHQGQDGFLPPTCGPDVRASGSVSDSALGEVSVVGFDRNQPNHLNPELWEMEEKEWKGIGRGGCQGPPGACWEWAPFFQGQGWHQGQASSVPEAHDGSGMLTLSSSGFMASASSWAASSSALSEEGRLSPRETVEVSETVRTLVSDSSWHQTAKLPRAVPGGAAPSMVRAPLGLLHTTIRGRHPQGPPHALQSSWGAEHPQQGTASAQGNDWHHDGGIPCEFRAWKDGSTHPKSSRDPHWDSVPGPSDSPALLGGLAAPLQGTAWHPRAPQLLLWSRGKDTVKV